MPSATPPRVPLWKRLVGRACTGGALFFAIWATVHWHLGLTSVVGLLIALIVVVWLVVGRALGLPTEWWWRGWSISQPSITPSPPDSELDPTQPPAPPASS
jgi:hypothetical protein